MSGVGERSELACHNRVGEVRNFQRPGERERNGEARGVVTVWG